MDILCGVQNGKKKQMGLSLFLNLNEPIRVSERYLGGRVFKRLQTSCLPFCSECTFFYWQYHRWGCSYLDFYNGGVRILKWRQAKTTTLDTLTCQNALITLDSHCANPETRAVQYFLFQASVQKVWSLRALFGDLECVMCTFLFVKYDALVLK